MVPAYPVEAFCHLDYLGETTQMKEHQGMSLVFVFKEVRGLPRTYCMPIRSEFSDQKDSGQDQHGRHSCDPQYHIDVG